MIEHTLQDVQCLDVKAWSFSHFAGLHGRIMWKTWNVDLFNATESKPVDFFKYFAG